MTDHRTSNTPQPDDARLAEFADSLLSGHDVEQIEMATDSQELRELQHTVLRLTQAFGTAPDQPDPAMAERIRANLIAEWQRSMGRQTTSTRAAGEQKSTLQSWLDRLFPRTLSGRRSYSMALAGASLVALIVLAFVITTQPESGTGASGSTDNATLPLLIAAGLVLVGATVLWFLSREGK